MGIRETFIQNLKYYRKKSGLTQEKLAESIGMSTTYIGTMEACGRLPHSESDRQYCLTKMPAQRQ